MPRGGLWREVITLSALSCPITVLNALSISLQFVNIIMLGYLGKGNLASGAIGFNIFYRLIKQASYVLCSDADINDMVLEYFDKIGIKYYLIENNYCICGRV